MIKALKDARAKRVLDLGCGGGALLRELVKEPEFTEIHGVDVSAKALQEAARKLHLDRMSDRVARADHVAAVGVDVRGHRARRVRRGGADGGRRARRPVAAARAGALGVHGGAAGDRAGHHAERRVQPAVRNVAGRPDAALRPPFRMDSSGVRGSGRTVSRSAVATPCVTCRSGRRTPNAARRPRWPCSAWGDRTDGTEDPGPVSGGADRRLRLGQVHVRPQALPAHADAVERLLPRARRRRRERPVGVRGGVRRAALRRGQAAGGRSRHGDRRDQRAGARPRQADRGRQEGERARRRDRPRHPDRRVPRAQRGTPGPRLRRARREAAPRRR